jgi:hypothetical protein
MFLVNLLWYHTTPGHRRAQFPSWSWAGWQGGSISPETFIVESNEHSMLHPQTAIWIEEESGSLRNVDDIPTLPDTWLPYQESHFLYIETRTRTCFISYLESNSLPRWHHSTTGWYATFTINKKTCYAKFFLSDTKTPAKAKQYMGLILPFAFAGLTSAKRVITFRSILIVEDKGACWERVGVVHVYFCTGEANGVDEFSESCCVEEDGWEWEIGMETFVDFENGWAEEVEGRVRRFRIG